MTPYALQTSHPYHDPVATFYQVDRKSDKMETLTQIFKDVLEPLYGSQEKALKQISESADRVCYLLCEEEAPRGVIVFKTSLSNEFNDNGIKNSIEIKSLFVTNSANNSGRGLGGRLLNKIKEEAKKIQPHLMSYHVTVSETKQESLNFFQRKGFQIVAEWDGKYVKNTKEFLLHCPAENLNAEIKKTDLVARPLIASASTEKTVMEPLFEIVDAHLGDIHCLQKLSSGHFISGSKDNSLYEWDQKGHLVKEVKGIEPTVIDAKDWITSTAVLNDRYWVSGERSGNITLWNTEGRFIKNIKPKLPKTWHISQPLNRQRVTTLAAGVDKTNPTLFIGFPTRFDEFNLIESATVSSAEVHKNDWVYCIHPLKENAVLTVTGGTIELWKKSDQIWKKNQVLMKEPKRVGKQRNFISSLKPLSEREDLFGMTVFNGEVKVYDLNQQAVVNTWKEHEKRVWNLESLTPQTFATSAEDGTIRLWDIRQSNSIHTISLTRGEQSHSLLSLNENMLIAGVGKGDGKNQNGTLRFYDSNYSAK